MVDFYPRKPYPLDDPSRPGPSVTSSDDNYPLKFLYSASYFSRHLSQYKEHSNQI